MIKGQCQCGAVKFRYEGELTKTIICHCKDCQIAQRSAFAFNSPIDKRLVTFEHGKDALKEFFSSPNKGEFKHEVRQFQKPYDNQQAEQISLMV